MILMLSIVICYGSTLCCVTDVAINTFGWPRIHRYT